MECVSQVTWVSRIDACEEGLAPLFCRSVPSPNHQSPNLKPFGRRCRELLSHEIVDPTAARPRSLLRNMVAEQPGEIRPNAPRAFSGRRHIIRVERLRYAPTSSARLSLKVTIG